MSVCVAFLVSQQVESELSDVCLDVLNLLEDTLVKNNQKENEARVFYLKMTGDYYRYLAEFVTDKSYESKAADYYKQAQEISQKVLEPTHPIRLGLALNYSVCFYEILKDKKAACELAKSAFDQAISGLDKLPEASYKDSTLIMQLLRDNLTRTCTHTHARRTCVAPCPLVLLPLRVCLLMPC